MCNVFEQVGRVVKPGGRVVVYLRGPGGRMAVVADEKGRLPRPFVAIYAGAAKSERLHFLWLRQKKGEEVLVPGVSKFGDWHVKQNRQLDHDLPAGSALAGVLLPEQTGRDGKVYRLLKVQTRAATPEEEERVGNDRMPVVIPWPDAPEITPPPEDPPRETKAARPVRAKRSPGAAQLELFQPE